MTIKHDQTNKIKCPHCEKDFNISLDFEYEGLEISARLTIEDESKEDESK